MRKYPFTNRCQQNNKLPQHVSSVTCTIISSEDNSRRQIKIRLSRPPWFRPLDCTSNKGQRFPKESAARYDIASIAIFARTILSRHPGKSRRYSLASRWDGRSNLWYHWRIVSTLLRQHISMRFSPLMSRRSDAVNLDFASITFEDVRWDLFYICTYR